MEELLKVRVNLGTPRGLEGGDGFSLEFLDSIGIGLALRFLVGSSRVSFACLIG